MTATMTEPTAIPTGMKGLSPELITQLMGKTRQRNAYGPKLAEFMESDEAGINPAEVWPLDFGQKAAGTLYQGFINAAKKAGIQDQLKILQNDDNVFLLHKERVQLAQQALLDAATDDDE